METNERLLTSKDLITAWHRLILDDYSRTFSPSTCKRISLCGTWNPGGWNLLGAYSTNWWHKLRAIRPYVSWTIIHRHENQRAALQRAQTPAMEVSMTFQWRSCRSPTYKMTWRKYIRGGIGMHTSWYCKQIDMCIFGSYCGSFAQGSRFIECALHFVRESRASSTAKDPKKIRFLNTLNLSVSITMTLLVSIKSI